MKTVYVTVPATTANLGPGFDCLGLALGLYNEIQLREQAAGLHIEVTGEGAAFLPTDASNLVYRAARTLFDLVGQKPAGLHLQQHNHIPVSSGMGSSAAAVIGGLLAANALLDSPLSRQELLQVAISLEGHPDNVTPAMRGGLNLATPLDDNRYHIEPIAIPDAEVAIILPAFDLSTADARSYLPAEVPRKAAVFNMGRLVLLLRALEAGDWSRLEMAMQDRLHQPYRVPLVPGMADAFAAGQAAGAAGIAISGAGPSLLAFAPPARLDNVVDAVALAFAQAGLRSRSWRLPLDREGAFVAVQ